MQIFCEFFRKVWMEYLLYPILLLSCSNYDSSDYVPSPAPGSIPRYSSQLRRPPPQPLKRPHQTASRRGGQGYLV